MAEQIADVFTEVVVAPSFDADAVAVLTGKKNVRLLAAPAARGGVEFRPIGGGMLVQTGTSWTPRATIRRRGPWPRGEPVNAAGLDDLVFAWRASVR